MKQKNLLLILIPIFIVTVLWVIFSIYHNRVSSTIKDPLTIQIAPIEGNFDQESIRKIKNRERINPLFDAQGIPTPTPTEESNPEIDTEINDTTQAEDITPINTDEETIDSSVTNEEPSIDPNEVFSDESE